MQNINEKALAVTAEVSKAVLGKPEVVLKIMMAILARGHVLIEDIPGVGKTTLAQAFARAMDLTQNRVQFTPDLMPSDVLGTSVFNMKTQEFDFHAGPVFADIILADEINRAPAKTQAALFEVMEERQATIDGTSYKMGGIYSIIATQNPVEQEGTYRLPEAQLDRFIMKITMGYPSVDEEVEILSRHNAHTSFARLDDVKPAITKDQLLELRGMMDNVVVDLSLLRYIAQIVAQSRESKMVYMGCSPRASVDMLRCAKAYALLQGRDFVIPDDIKTVAPPIMQHRLMLTAETEMEGYTPVVVAQKLIDMVEVPK